MKKAFEVDWCHQSVVCVCRCAIWKNPAVLPRIHTKISGLLVAGARNVVRKHLIPILLVHYFLNDPAADGRKQMTLCTRIF